MCANSSGDPAGQQQAALLGAMRTVVDGRRDRAVDTAQARAAAAVERVQRERAREADTIDQFLRDQLDQRRTLVERRVEGVAAGVDAFQAAIDDYVDALLEAEDPVRFAELVVGMPSPPSVDALIAAAQQRAPHGPIATAWPDQQTGRETPGGAADREPPSAGQEARDPTTGAGTAGAAPASGASPSRVAPDAAPVASTDVIRHRLREIAERRAALSGSRDAVPS